MIVIVVIGLLAIKMLFHNRKKFLQPGRWGTSSGHADLGHKERRLTFGANAKCGIETNSDCTARPAEHNFV